MNLKTTVILVLLTLAGAAYWASSAVLRPVTPESSTLRVLTAEITPDRLSRIEIGRAEPIIVLERKAGQAWALPGNWPVRAKEVEELVATLGGLRSRFAPIPIAADDPAKYGLADSQQPLRVTVKANGTEYRLRLGEETQSTNRFSRPTYLRLGDAPEVVRLAPHLIDILDRPANYYQQRRLFPAERAKAADVTPGQEQLQAKALAAQGGDSASGYTLNKTTTSWELMWPVHDAADPDKVKSILWAVPDIWAEEFVVAPKKLAEYGLDKPSQSLRVTKENGDIISLAVGKESRVKTRTVTRPAPMGMPPGMPRTPQQETIHEPYRYAKLENNDQVFEIKADKIKEVFTPADTLRDAHIARFRNEDVRRVELHLGGQDIVLTKEKEQWRLQKPQGGEAETSKVTELLDKLSALQARDKDVIDSPDLKRFHLNPPEGKLVIDIAPPKEPARTITIDLGREDPTAKKAYVRVAGFERVNAVEDSFLALLKRPALAYRGRHLLDLSVTDLARIDIDRAGETFRLEQANGQWRLTKPVQAEADGFKVNQLASDVGRLEAVEFIDNSPAPVDLDKRYGLAKLALRIELVPAKAGEKTRVLAIGKQRGDRPEYYAKLDSSPAVFAVRKDVHDSIDQSSLAYRPLTLWQVAADDVVAIVREHGDARERLERQKDKWQLTKPFQATVSSTAIEPLLNDLANLRAQRYESHVAKDLKAYGLDRPAHRIALQTKSKAAGGKPPEDQVLLVGKPADGGSRFAKLAKGEAVVIIDEKTAKAAEQKAIDLLDRNLLSLDTTKFQRIDLQGPKRTLSLERKADAWQGTSGQLHFSADRVAMTSLVDAVTKLEAERFADYGAKVQLDSYGLAAPQYTARLMLSDGASKTESHAIALGNPVSNEPGAHYARVDNGPGVVVLAPAVANALKRTYLDFIDRSLLKFRAASVNGLVCRREAEELRIDKRADGWQMTKPVPLPADGPAVEGVIDQLSSLRGSRIVAHPASDLKAYGLDVPAATVAIDVGQSAKAPPALLIGSQADDKSGDRYAMAQGGQAVGVISGRLAKQLLGGALAFRDRNIARFADADHVEMVRGPRRTAFNKIEGTWKMTSPVQAEAEQADLEELLSALAHLRADELVADKPAGLTAYGLDHPSVAWRFSSGEKEVLHLLVGRLEDQSRRAFAKLAKDDLVFLLDPTLTTRVLAEYRRRSLWLPLDTAQVSSLRFGFRIHPFTLQKLDGQWRSTDHPQGEVKAEAVSQTLDALARLRAERFIVDKDADLKLYGLDPPEFVLEAVSPAGNRTIHIGRTEAGSGLYYARVPEAGRSDVFVISATDAQVLVRPLTAFTKAGK
jgi:hypothetical protein